MPKRSGRRSAAQTPAPPSERIHGSKVNPKGSAASEKTASSIKVSEQTESSLRKKLEEFKKKYPSKKNVTLADLKAVYRRGAGAYSSTHRPTISGGAPNSRNAWAQARVNKFLEKAAGKPVKKAYVQDDDLLKYDKGGVVKPKFIQDIIDNPDEYRILKSFDSKYMLGWEVLPNGKVKLYKTNIAQGYREFDDYPISYESGKHIRRVVILAEKKDPQNFIILSYDGYIRLTNPALWEKIKKAKETTSEGQILLWYSLPEKEKKAFIYDLIDSPDSWENRGVLKQNLLADTPFDKMQNLSSEYLRKISKKHNITISSILNLNEVSYRIYEKAIKLGFKPDAERKQTSSVDEKQFEIIKRVIDELYGEEAAEIKDKFEQGGNVNTETMFFWHGGDLNNYDEIIAQKSGRYEYGAGLYLTTELQVAVKYAKGSRRLYLIEVEKGIDINDATISEKDAHKFIDTYVKSLKRKEIKKRLLKYTEEGKVKANVFNNVILNEKAIQSTKTYELRDFYVRNGIDYEIVDNAYGWGEKMMVLYNMKKIVDKKVVKESDAYKMELPKFKDGGLIMLAPNGKPSFLTPEQYKLVRTPEFKAWFGDWENDPANASKILDENGEPCITYHGTNQEFTVFDIRNFGIRDSGFYGVGFYFVFYPFQPKSALGEAKYYGSKVIPAFLNIRNPFDISSLSNYKGFTIHAIGTSGYMFMMNLHKLFPDENFFGVQRKTYGKMDYDGSVEVIREDVPVAEMARLFEKYENEIEWKDSGNRLYAKLDGQVVEQVDLIEENKEKGFYGDDLEYAKAILIGKVLEKKENIVVDYLPEGLMTRNPKISELIKKGGYDGVIQSVNGDEVVAFQPNQIKLADGSNTTFDGNNPDIRFEQGGYVSAYKSRVKGQDVETGKPVTIKTLKNTEKAPYLGARFGQDVEPAGIYVIQKETDYPMSGWVEGVVNFKNPVVIDVTTDTLVQWKRELSAKYKGKKQHALTEKLMKEGYDGIITRQNGELGEIIIFKNADYSVK